MEIAEGRIINVGADGITIRVPYNDWERFEHRKYEVCQVALKDGRTITPDQRRKSYALLREIAEWMGDVPAYVKQLMKLKFIYEQMETLDKKVFSLSDVDETTAREFISYLIDFIIEHEIPTRRPLYLEAEDITRYVYSCLMHKRCAVCGKKADLHHVDAVGMGRDRTDMDHIGLRCLPLCRDHHEEFHIIGNPVALDKYHLVPVKIDSEIVKKYKLGRKKHESVDDHR